MAENLYENFILRPDGNLALEGDIRPRSEGKLDISAQLKAIRDVSMLGLDPLQYNHNELNPMDLAAWEAQQAALEAAGYPSMPKIPGTNTGAPAKSNKAAAKEAEAEPVSLLDMLLGGLFGNESGGAATPVRTDGTSRSGMNDSIAVRPQDRGNANYVNQARENAAIGSSGSDNKRWRDFGFNSERAYGAARDKFLAENGYNSKDKYKEGMKAFASTLRSKLETGSVGGSGGSSSKPKPTTQTPTTAGPMIKPMTGMSKASIDARNVDLNNVVAGMILNMLLPGGAKK